jgi:hypothetical protein
MKVNFKKLIPHILVLLGFIIVSMAYFSPLLDGKQLNQSDIAQYKGMSKEQTDFRDATGEEPYWTNAAFGGMPTYQLGAQYPYSFNKMLDRTLRFLPRPADYMFLFFIGIYILLIILKVDWKLAIIASLAFGLSTNMLDILSAGHNAKAHAIAYMPLVIAGILLTFKGRYIWGFLLLAVSMSLEIMANHFQMTYYLLLLVVIIGIVYLIDAIKRKQLPHYFKSLGIMVVAVIIGIATNATSLLATKEYTAFSTRGESAIKVKTDGSIKEETDGLSYEYITEYSYGILESLNLFIPRFMGGSSVESLPDESKTAKELYNLGASPQQARQFVQQVPMYWGDQTFVGAPAYVGATIIFLFVFALFMVKGRLKYWIVAGVLLSLFLSWGKNLEFLTRFFIDYIPMYDKFRAVSTTQVILRLCIPILAVFGLSQLFNSVVRKEEKLNALKWTTVILGGLTVVILLFKNTLFNFESPYDSMFIEQMGVDFVKAIRADRATLLSEDTLRTLILIALVAVLIFGYLKEKINEKLVVAGLVILVLFDLVGVDKRYVNDDNFVSKHLVDQPFQPNSADQQILQDKGHFRVLDLSGSPLNSARASFFHNSLGGYHGAKPKRMQDLFEFHVYEGNQAVLNMLNVKYNIIKNEGNLFAQRNPYANGNAWFIDSIQEIRDDNEVILYLSFLDAKKKALVTPEFTSKLKQRTFKMDSTATINLKSYQPNELIYESESSNDAFAVFSEIYYEHGWKAYIDDKEVDILRVNYTLRGLEIPSGEHEIVFKFEPDVVKTGSSIVLTSSILLMLLILGGIFYEFKAKTKT